MKATYAPTKGFAPTGFGNDVFKGRYAFDQDEEWDSACLRLVDSVMINEPFAKRMEAYEILVNGKFCPGGRIWRNAGRTLQQLLNCFVIPVGDSREAWGKSISDMLVTSGMGGGVGANFSRVRGRDYPIRGMGGKSTGAVSLMRMWNGVGNELVSGGNRRIALMLSLDINHPDVEEFINDKLDLKNLNNANVSVVIPNDLSPDEFVNLVRSDGELRLRFNGGDDVLGRGLRARDLWERIVSHAWQSGEPGILNGYLANQDHSLPYNLTSTNPCGEIWLPDYGCCCLGALVLPAFVNNGRVDWPELDRVVSHSVRFLDNVLDVNDYPLPEIQKMAQSERRIGLGVMGLHSMLLDLGIKYSESGEFVNELFDFIKCSAYKASIELAIEKGSFDLYDPDLVRSGFASRLPSGIRERIVNHGLRNCALLTIAPTGTTSIMMGVSGGIEPIFSPVYIRRWKSEGEKAGEFIENETLVISQDYTDHMGLVEGAYDLTPRQHFAVQIQAQKHIDNAVSKTINMAKDFPVEGLSEAILEALPHVKGVALYREGSREDEPLKHVPLDKTLEVLYNWTGPIENEDGSTSIDPCVTGKCDV